MEAFTYGNLIATFFAEEKLIQSRPERLNKCFEYVMHQKYYSSQSSRDAIIKKIESVDATFMKKWRDSKCMKLERFKEDNKDWIHRILEVKIFLQLKEF